MTQAGTQPVGQFGWLVNNFADNVPGVAHAVVISVDGLLLTATDHGQRSQSPGPRDAARARGFLSSFQAGVRRSENDKGEGKT